MRRDIKYNGIKTLEVLEGADKYNQWISDTIRQYMMGPVIEIGSGIGNISYYFKDFIPFHVTEIDSGMLKFLKKRFRSQKNVHVERLDITKKIPMKYVGRFSTVFSVNVLEHIREDIHALANMKNLLKFNGRVVLLVPAKKRAFNRTDKILDHYRRYEKDELTKKLVTAGYAVEKIYYFNFVGLMSWILRDKIERNNFHLKPYQIATFDIIVPFLKRIEKIINIPVGISLIAIARKI